MKLSILALAAVALIALPASGYAQTTPSQEKHNTGRDDAQSSAKPTGQDVKGSNAQKQGVGMKGSSGSASMKNKEKGTTGAAGSSEEDKDRGRNSPAEPVKK